MPTKVCKFDGGKYDGKPCWNRQCRFLHFFQPHPRQMFREQVTKKQLRKERRKKKKKRKRLKKKEESKRQKLDARKELRRKRKKRTVGPIEFERKILPEIRTYDEVHLLTQIERFSTGENKLKIHCIPQLNGTKHIVLDLMLDSKIVGKRTYTSITKSEGIKEICFQCL